MKNVILGLCLLVLGVVGGYTYQSVKSLSDGLSVAQTLSSKASPSLDDVTLDNGLQGEYRAYQVQPAINVLQ